MSLFYPKVVNVPPIQILRGSHKCGRIEHLMVAGQTGADLERVKEIEKVCPMEYVEMEPGMCTHYPAE